MWKNSIINSIAKLRLFSFGANYFLQFLSTIFINIFISIVNQQIKT